MDREAKYIEKGRQRIRKNNRFDLSIGELRMFVEMMQKDRLSAIINSYYMGVEAGSRMAAKERSEYGRAKEKGRRLKAKEIPHKD